MTNPIKTVAFVTTGDEISDGDVLNTNGPAMARELVGRGLEIKQHLMVPDNLVAITSAIHSSLKNHDVIIITGGLGPTSDDVTRFALAKAIDTELVADAASWQHIVARLTQFNFPVGEHNRQQTLFPIGAKVLPNPHGTANGCFIQQQNKHIFMLPGPPHECLPMFQNYVLPHLPNNEFHKLHWLLMGLSEGDIAAKLDAVLKPLNCRTGYRAVYPYLEFKVWANDADALQQCIAIIKPLLNDFLVSEKNIPASQQLRDYLASDAAPKLKISDTATGGVLQSLLLRARNRARLEFVTADAADINFTGLTEYWQNAALPVATHIKLSSKKPVFVAQKDFFCRGSVAREFAAEWACWQLLHLFIV